MFAKIKNKYSNKRAVDPIPHSSFLLPPIEAIAAPTLQAPVKAAMSMSSDMASSARNNRLAWAKNDVSPMASASKDQGIKVDPPASTQLVPGKIPRGVVYMRSTYYQSGIKNSSKKPSDEATKVADSTTLPADKSDVEVQSSVDASNIDVSPASAPIAPAVEVSTMLRNPIDTTVDNAIDNNMVGLSTPRDNLTAHASSSAMIEGAITMNGVKLIDNVGGPSTVIEKDESILETTPTMESLGTTELAMTTSPIHTTSAQGSNANMDTFASGSTSPNTVPEENMNEPNIDPNVDHNIQPEINNNVNTNVQPEISTDDDTPTPPTPHTPPTPPVNLATTVSTNSASPVTQSWTTAQWTVGLICALPVALPVLLLTSPILIASAAIPIESNVITPVVSWLASKSGIYGAVVVQKAEAIAESFVDEVWSHSSSSTISLVDDDDDDDDDGDLKSFGRALVKHSDVDNTIRLLRVLPIALPTLAICSPIIVASIASSTIPTLTAWLASRIHGAFVWKKAEMTSESVAGTVWYDDFSSFHKYGMSIIRSNSGPPNTCTTMVKYNGGYNSSHYLRNFSIAPPTMALCSPDIGASTTMDFTEAIAWLVEQTAINGAMLLLQIEEITESLARIWFDCPHSVLDDVLSINDDDGGSPNTCTDMVKYTHGQTDSTPTTTPTISSHLFRTLPVALSAMTLCAPIIAAFVVIPMASIAISPIVWLSAVTGINGSSVLDHAENLTESLVHALFKDGPVYPLATSNSSATLVDGGMSTATSSTDLLKDDKDGKDDSDGNKSPPLPPSPPPAPTPPTRSTLFSKVRSLLIYLIADPNEPEDEEPLHRTLLTPPHLMKGLPPPPNPTDEWVQPPYRGGGIHAPNSLPVHRIPAYMRNLPSVEPPKPTRKSYFGMFTDVAVNVAGWAVGKSGMEVVEGVLCGF